MKLIKNIPAIVTDIDGVLVNEKGPLVKVINTLKLLR